LDKLLQDAAKFKPTRTKKKGILLFDALTQYEKYLLL
jgi:hypothetical protein